MALNYVVEPNLLTNPHSYKCRVEPNSKLGYAEVAEQINLRQPTISAEVVEVVLKAFAAEVEEQLLAGNWIVFENFVSFMTAMPTNLANAGDPLPGSVAEMRVKTSRTFKNNLLENAEYNRVGYPEKIPTITEAKDSVSSLVGFFENGKSFTIQGSNIGWESAYLDDPQVGIFVTNAAGTVTSRQNSVSLNNPSLVMITANLAHTDGQPEITLEARNRFTENGSLRTNVYSKKLRGLVEIADANTNKLFGVGTTDPLTTVTAWTGGEDRVEINLYYNVASEMFIRTRTVSSIFGTLGDWESPVEITGDGVYTVGAAGDDLEITLAAGAFVILQANLTSYGRIMSEVCDLSNLTP